MTLEKVRVTAHSIQNEFRFWFFVEKKPVGFDVKVSNPSQISGELVVLIFLRNRGVEVTTSL